MSRSFFRLSALLALLSLGLVLVTLWPLPDLGFITDMDTGTITQVRPRSIAEAVGLLPGDQVMSIYGYSWHEINTRISLLPLPWQYGTPTEMIIERGSESRQVVLYAGPPSTRVQIEKLLRFFTAIVCWGTGYLLGTSPRADTRQQRWVALFWVLLGLTIGLYQLADLASYILAVAILWFQCTLLAPLAVGLHMWYPSRPLAPALRKWTAPLLLVTMLSLQFTAASQISTAGSTVVAFERMLRMALVTFIGSFLLSWGLLAYTYRTAVVKHVRRQIRLIGLACVLVACWWVQLLIVFLIAPDLTAVVPAGITTIVAAAVPLAYLASGVSADLMRLDQIARRVVISALAGLMVIGVVGTLVWTGLLEVAPAALLIVAGALYWPCFQLIERVLSRGLLADERYETMRQTAAQLSQSLDRTTLVRTFLSGLDQTFQHPRLALYCLEDGKDETLYLAEARRMELPPTVRLAFAAALSDTGHALLSASEVQRRLGHQPLVQAEVDLVFHPDMLHLGVIRSASNQPLALLVLGPRGDYDPYREADRQEIGHLLAAAALAFANSASYMAALKAENDTRKTLRQAQDIRQRTVAEVARTIHDDILNGTLLRNQRTLRALAERISDRWAREKLQQISEEERATSANLRYFCERLEPTAMMDPFGLEANLRQCAEDAEELWGKPVRLEPVPEDGAVPVDVNIQHQLVLITKEALTNAITHARGATTITMRLCFPSGPGEPLTLSIRDNGRVGKRVEPRQSHFGLRYMKESAYAVGLDIDWKPLPDGGTEVVVWGSPTLPPVLLNDAAEIEPRYWVWAIPVDRE